jgi:LysR family hydrogen peroxide-inducible transcriptional activator
MATTFPKLLLNIDELQTHQIIASLENETLDVGLLATPLKAEGLEEEKLFLEPFSLYVHKSHPLAKRKSISEDDLDGSDMWLLSEGHCLRSQILRFCSLKSTQPVFRNVHFAAGNLETLQRLVETGSGYTLLPWLAAQRPHPNDATIVTFKAPVPQRQVSLVWRRSQLKRRAITALAEAIRATLPDELRALQNNRNNQGSDALPAW